MELFFDRSRKPLYQQADQCSNRLVKARTIKMLLGKCEGPLQLSDPLFWFSGGKTEQTKEHASAGTYWETDLGSEILNIRLH